MYKNISSIKAMEDQYYQTIDSGGTETRKPLIWLVAVPQLLPEVEAWTSNGLVSSDEGW